MQMLFLLVIGPVVKVLYGLVIGSKGLFRCDDCHFSRMTASLFLPSFRDDLCHKKTSITQNFGLFNPLNGYNDIKKRPEWV